ncbi:hypothetical protein cyc_08931 [Cyclospora cayetanensis]|uniref:Uncharacterized protein n=1 Tax=Cyclospora cayetanensis TaxID=88456 RepID=A0A1D3CUT8_9EIME|nr:hypothetical protein cyc_08931 [Cyclospora cayetanensis]
MCPPTEILEGRDWMGEGLVASCETQCLVLKRVLSLALSVSVANVKWRERPGENLAVFRSSDGGIGASIRGGVQREWVAKEGDSTRETALSLPPDSPVAVPASAVLPGGAAAA